MNAERKQRKDKLELKILHSTFHDMAREHGAYARTHSKCDNHNNKQRTICCCGLRTEDLNTQAE